MHRRCNHVLALALGLLGGFLSRYIQPAPVLAQTQTSAPKEAQAQSFVLVDEKNNVVGTFKPSVTPPGQTPTVVFVDQSGREIWRAGVALRVISQK
jgi:hypothetical protein